MQPVPSVTADPWLTRRELAAGGAIVLVLAVVGALVGLLWAAISPARPVALIGQQHHIIPDEKEGFIATDGRFVLLTAAVGLLAALLAWRLLRDRRGPLIVGALAAGGIAGSYLTALIGQLIGGGHASAPPNTVIQSQLQVHAVVLLVIEPLIAVFVYAVCVLFAQRDDLGVRPVPPPEPAPADVSYPF